MKSIVFCTLLCVFALPAFAQFKINVGLKAGANYSTLIKDNLEINPRYRASFVGGAFARFTLGRVILQPELLYSTKKVEITSTQGGTVTGSIKTENLDVPLLVGFNLVNTDLIQFRVMAGPVASFKLSEDQGPFDLGATSFKNAKWGYQVGLGVDIWKFTGDFRYEGALDETLKLGGTYFEPTDDRPRSGLFQVTVGYKLF